MDQLATVVIHQTENEERSCFPIKRHLEVHRCHAFPVVVEKRLPPLAALSWWPTFHVLQHVPYSGL